ncbi:hypothetical protein PPL_06889 [Heterostelium album PN500]|uniref:Uncharacterized protein n=1 Tax=Heterostelium pallidum (strain ATCC 26659 / Pp 5 / PN500) TaxID=670386 RepID=D3BDT6_HETP5|nr:hypothetical protein PPL_06889 [Heterostelium album PN500]EFA80067.1 hypothetical protein PPL_06889 [Heterostelium album PN500]|eukprot:XP_020432187.1 hypothetical protein PPL_06889 [Heterostelium album PN500]
MGECVVSDKDEVFKLMDNKVLISKNNNNNNNNNNINNNDRHIFVNLQLHLIQRIILAIDDDIDRICFSFSCKRWFINRNKYLLLNCDLFILKSSSHVLNEKRFYSLNSFKDIISKSFDHKEIGVDYNPKNKGPFSTPYGQMITLANYRNLVFAKDYESIRFLCHCYLEIQSDIDVKSYRLPSNVKEVISIHALRESFLPLGLERLEINVQIRNIDVALLPRSLKVLKIKGMRYDSWTIDFRWLPPNLEELKCVARKRYDSDNFTQLPSTLKILTISKSWLENISQLQSIHTLRIVVQSNDTRPFEPGIIPDCVRNLTIKSCIYRKNIAIEILPPNLKYLKLVKYFNFKKHIFSSLASLETLDLSTVNLEKKLKLGKLPTKLVNLFMPSWYPHQIKNLNIKGLKSLERLDLGGSFGKVKGLPKSIKTLCFNNDNRLLISRNSIPKSVETIQFKQSDLSMVMNKSFWPNVKSIWTNCDFNFPKSKTNEIPQTITSITFGRRKGRIDYQARRLSDQYFLVLGCNRATIVHFKFLSTWLKLLIY